MLHTLSKQYYHSSVLYSHHQMYDAEAECSEHYSKSNHLTCHINVRDELRFVKYREGYCYYTLRGLGRVICLVVYSSNQWCSQTQACSGTGLGSSAL